MRVELGFKSHSGWAVLVVVGASGNDVDRRRVELIEGGEFWAKQPYHAAEGLEPDEAHTVVKNGIESAQRLAIRKMPLPATTTVIAPAGYIVQSWAIGGTAAATAGGGATAAFWAVASAPAVKTVVTATAGVLLLIGTVNNVHAGTGLPDNPVVSKASAFRAVAVADFEPLGGVQAASSAGPPKDFFHTSETAKGKFNVGTKVLFNHVPHIIVGGFSAS